MASTEPFEQQSAVDSSEEMKRLAELKIAEERDEQIEKAILTAFKGLKERLTIERINNLKAILSDIIEIQIEIQRRNQVFNLQNFIDIISEKARNKVDEKRLMAIFDFLTDEERLASIFSLLNKALEDVKLKADNLDKIYQNQELIIGIDKILEDKKRYKMIKNLSEQDKAVTNDFAVGVREILEKRKESPGVNKYATSVAVVVGGTCLGTGINMIIVAGSIAAAGAFPVGLAVLGGVIIVGAALYYAKKKRGRIGKFLPSLYKKARLLRQARIKQLDGEERHKQLENLTKKYEQKNEKSKKIAKQKISNYEKKHNAEYNRVCDKIEILQTELDTINEVLEPTSLIDFKGLKEKFSVNDSKAYERVLMVESVPSDKERNEKSVYLVKNKLVGEFVVHYHNGIKWCQTTRKTDALDKLLSDQKEWHDSSEVEKIISICGCAHFKRMIGFKNINNFNNLSDFLDHLKDRKQHIEFGTEGSQADASVTNKEGVKKSKKLESQREGDLVQLKELKKRYEDSLQSLETEVNSQLAEENEANAEKYKMDASLLETKPLKGNKSVKLKWYKKIVPYFAYWGTCIALNFKSNAAAAKEASEVAKAALKQAEETHKSRGGDDFVLPQEFQMVADFSDNVEKIRAQVEERVSEVVKSLKLDKMDGDFDDYLTVEECYLSDEDFKEKIARVVSGENIKNTMLKILYTHPSTVLSLFDKNPDMTIKHVNESLENVKRYLENFSGEWKHLDSLQVYFPPDKNNHVHYKRFMLVSDENNAKDQEAFFEHMFLIKQSIMEVNKTLETVSKVSPNDFDKVKSGVKEHIKSLISAAAPVAGEIEKQLTALNVAEESLQYREVYRNTFKDLLKEVKSDEQGGKITPGELLKKADIEDAAFVLKTTCFEEFIQYLMKNEKELANKNFKKDKFNEDGILQDFIKLFSEEQVKQEDKIALYQKIKLIKAANKTADKMDPELKMLQEQYEKFFERRIIDVKDIKKLDGKSIGDTKELKDYIENNEHTYHSQKILIEEKRAVLEEVQKSLVLSIPEIEKTLELKPTHVFRRIAKRRRIGYGIPYNPSISLSMDYIANLFKSTRATFKKMKGLVFNLKFSEMTVKSIHLNLDEILIAIQDPNIPISFENALKFLKKIKFPGFESMFGALFRELEKEGAVLSRENHEKIVLAIKGLRDFLAGIQSPWCDYTFPDLVKKIDAISIEIGKLTFRLTRLNPRDVNDALEIKEIMLKLKSFKLDFDKLKLSEVDFKKLVAELPDGFPFKNQFGRFVTSFDPLFQDFNAIRLQFDNFNLDNFPLDDFLYICNCYQGFEKFGGFKNLAIQFPAWLKEYEAGFNWNPFGESDGADVDKDRLDQIRIQLEKFVKFKMSLSNLNVFLMANGDFKFPKFLALPGFPELSKGLGELNAKFDDFGDISLDDISFVMNFLGNFGGIDGLRKRLGGLKNLIASLTLDIRSLNRLNTKALEELKNKLKAATIQFEMFKSFSLKIDKLSVILPKIPGFPKTDFSKFKSEYGTFLEGFETGLSGINLSIDLYNIRHAFSNFSPETFRIESLDFKFSDLYPKVIGLKEIISLDEIIRRVEQVRDLNIEAKTRFDEAIKHTMVESIEEALGIKKEQKKQPIEEINKFHKEVEEGLNVTLVTLYTLRAAVAIINAIKKGDGEAAKQELEELGKKVIDLHEEIKLIANEINMLKTFGSKSKAELERIAFLEKKLVSKEEDLQKVKLGLLEFKRMREAFAYLDKVNYSDPLILKMMEGIGLKGEAIVDQGKAIIVQVKEFLEEKAKDPIDAALAVVDISEVTLKLTPFVDIMQHIDPQKIKSEFDELIRASARFEELIAKDKAEKSNQEEELLKLNTIKNRLLELKQLNVQASELSKINFTGAGYATVLQSLGLAGDSVKLLIQNVEGMSSKGIDNALRHLTDAECSLKLALLQKKVAVIKDAAPLLEFLKKNKPANDLSLGDIFKQWNSVENTAKKRLNFFELGNAVKDVEDLLRELQSISAHRDDAFSHRLSAIRVSLGDIAGADKKDKQAVNNLYAGVYDFVNVFAIEQMKAEVNALKSVLKTDPKPGLIIDLVEQEKINVFVSNIEGSMEKFKNYRQFVKMFNELKIKRDNAERISPQELMTFESLLKQAKVLEAEIKYLLNLKKHFYEKLNITPESVHEELSRGIVSKDENTVDPFEMLQTDDKNSGEQHTVQKLKAVLNVLDNFYYLNGVQDIHQKLEPAESLFQLLKMLEEQKNEMHNPGLLMSGGPVHKAPTETEPVSKFEDPQKKSTTPPHPAPHD